MSVRRVGVEHAFGIACNLWGFIYDYRNLKLQQSPLGDLYLVGALLTNTHTWKCSSQIMKFYNEIPTSVEADFKLHEHSPD
ncbi:unnamed protein product [Discosporangium mesarthrocarpum]